MNSATKRVRKQTLYEKARQLPISEILKDELTQLLSVVKQGQQALLCRPTPIHIVKTLLVLDETTVRQIDAAFQRHYKACQNVGIDTEPGFLSDLLNDLGVQREEYE